MYYIKLAFVLTTFLSVCTTGIAKSNTPSPSQSSSTGVETDIPGYLKNSPPTDTTKATVTYPTTIYSELVTTVPGDAEAASKPTADNNSNEDDVDEEIPGSDIYPEWSNTSVNPYKINLSEMEDTLKISVGSFSFPVPKHYRVTSEFGFRKWRHHNGIDLKTYVGDSIVSAFDGMVRVTGYERRGYGHYVVVRHDNGLETVYGHLNKVLVSENQRVKAGELLGEGGNTGRSTGPHLHFEVRYLGQAINPRTLIDFDALACHSDTLEISKQLFGYVKEIEAVRYWTVKGGDTLGRIAQKTGVSVNRLCSLNGISRNKILRIGQRIRYT